MNRQPILFVSHGAPLLAIDAERGAPLPGLTYQLKKSQGILFVSAHWDATRITIGSTRTLLLIYDFSGLPKALYEMQYPPPGAPELAEAVFTLLGSEDIRRHAKNGRAPIAHEVYLLTGSGNMTHNIGALRPDGSESQTFPREFDNWTQEVLMRQDFDILLSDHDSAPAFSHNHPTEEHWLPLLFSTGAASTTHSAITFPVTGFEFGNLSRRTVLFT